MTFYVEVEEGLREQDFFLDGIEELVEKVAKAVLSSEGCPYEAELSVLFTSDQRMREINQSARGIDWPTDVLSFPAIEFASPGDFSLIEEGGRFFNQDTDELILGDIVISAERALFQAGEYGHSIEREQAFLLAHSLYHLLGYDHLPSGEASSIMEMKQEKLLDSIGITR